jgi:muramoyltetrapeptide carboxypeptidase
MPRADARVAARGATGALPISPSPRYKGWVSCPFTALPALSRGDAIRVIAPSSPFDGELFARGVELLRGRYEVRVDPGVHERHGYLAGDDARRVDELRRALAEPDTKAILCARGGYGAMRLLSALDLAAVRSAEKLLVGFSDVTALHALFLRAGLRTIHGPMVARIGRDGQAAMDPLVEALEGRPQLTFRGAGEAAVVEGTLLGGNLALVASLVGTGQLPDLRGAILFLEDVGERPYRLDRMLTQLELAGVLDGLAGLALGGFDDCDPGPDGVRARDVLVGTAQRLELPYVFDLPFGHGPVNLPLPLGVRARLEGDTLALLEGAVR